MPAEVDEEAGTGLSQPLQSLGLAGPPGLVPPVAGAAPKESLSVPASFLAELVDSAELQHFEAFRAATTVQGDQLVDLCLKQCWSTWRGP